VLWQASCNSEHIAVEDDILWREINLLPQCLVTPLAHAHLVLLCGCLTLLIKSHYHNCGTIAFAQSGLPYKLLLTNLQRDGVHNAFSLHTFQTLLNHIPFGGVNHEGKLGHSWLRDTHAHEFAHCCLAINQIRIEIEVKDVGLFLNLGKANFHSFIPLVRIDQLLEFCRAH